MSCLADAEWSCCGQSPARVVGDDVVVFTCGVCGGSLRVYRSLEALPSPPPGWVSWLEDRLVSWRGGGE